MEQIDYSHLVIISVTAFAVVLLIILSTRTIIKYYSKGNKQIENYSNNIFYTGVGFTPAMTLSMPILVGPGQIVTGFGGVNGYLTNLNYFLE